MSKGKEKGIEELYSYLIKNKDEISKEEYEELKKDFKNTLLKAYSEKSISKEFFEEYSQKIKELEGEGGIKEDTLFEKCPLCGKKASIIKVEKQKKKLFKQIKEITYVCTGCGSIWKKEDGEKVLYRLVKANRDTLYEGESLSLLDWKNIAETGFSRYHQLLNELAEGNFQRLKPKTQKEIPIILKKNETCFLFGTCSLYEPRAVREYKAGFGGISIPIGIKGVRFRLGGASGTSQSHEEIKEIDQGKLALTDKRLIFIGRNRNVVISLNKVLEVEIFEDAIMVSVVDKKKPKYFSVRDPEIWGNALIGLIKTT